MYIYIYICIYIYINILKYNLPSLQNLTNNAQTIELAFPPVTSMLITVIEMNKRGHLLPGYM